MLSCSSESVYKSKAEEKVSGFPHMVSLVYLSYIVKRSEMMKAEIDAVSV
jgi:hypothetical protein